MLGWVWLSTGAQAPPLTAHLLAYPSNLQHVTPAFCHVKHACNAVALLLTADDTNSLLP